MMCAAVTIQPSSLTTTNVPTPLLQTPLHVSKLDTMGKVNPIASLTAF